MNVSVATASTTNHAPSAISPRKLPFTPARVAGEDTHLGEAGADEIGVRGQVEDTDGALDLRPGFVR